MLAFGIPVAIYLCRRPVDFRKQFDGLCGEVLDYMGRDPRGGSLYVFYNRRRDRLKMLWWQADGFWLFYKRLESGTFELPLFGTAVECVLRSEQLHLILSGVALSGVRWRKRYKAIPSPKMY